MSFRAQPREDLIGSLTGFHNGDVGDLGVLGTGMLLSSPASGGAPPPWQALRLRPSPVSALLSHDLRPPLRQPCFAMTRGFPCTDPAPSRPMPLPYADGVLSRTASHTAALPSLGRAEAPSGRSRSARLGHRRLTPVVGACMRRSKKEVQGQNENESMEKVKKNN
jgi:hypothetical protein